MVVRGDKFFVKFEQGRIDRRRLHNLYPLSKSFDKLHQRFHQTTTLVVSSDTKDTKQKFARECRYIMMWLLDKHVQAQTKRGLA